MDDLITRLRTGDGMNTDTGQPATDEKLETLATGFLAVVPSIVWMKMVRDMRRTMIEAADALTSAERDGE